jgi:glycosyltransferase involved in cell wall biosynthesis
VRSEQEVVVPLGASLPAEQPVAALVDLLNAVNRSSVVLFLGRLTHKKRPDLLLEAWARAHRPSGAILVMAGPDEDITSAQLRRRADALNISDSVYFPGQVSGPEKSWLYHRSAVFVLASENENFGLTIGEAMLGGCHVIASSGVAASSFLELSNSGRVLPEMSSDSLARALSEALDDPEVTSRSGCKAAAYAEDHLSWRPLALKLAEIATRVGRNRT